MKLAVFDIDGTLTLGDGLGTRCFFSTIDDLFGAGRHDRTFESYAESTDCGIAREAVARVLGRDARDDEIDAFKTAYLDRLEREIRARDGAYRAIHGVSDFLPSLAARGGWFVAIATGNWQRAARLKLDSARIVPPKVMACSEDGDSRRAVLAAAVASSLDAAGVAAFEHVVYVGDQIWDFEAARAAGAAFVGIGSGSRERVARLASAGARIVDGFSDPAGILELLEDAGGPP